MLDEMALCSEFLPPLAHLEHAQPLVPNTEFQQ